MDIVTEFTTFDELWRLVAPSWLQGQWGSKLIGEFASVQDSALVRSKDAVKLRFPTMCSTDALTHIGADRRMPRWYSGETFATYRARLIDAWAHWAEAGTDRGVLRALYWAGFDDCTAYPAFDPMSEEYVWDPAQSVVVVSAHDFADQADRPDAPSTSWSMAWLFADADANNVVFDTHTWDTSTGWTTWGTGEDPDDWSAYGTWDFDVPQVTVDSWRDAVNTWKPAHVRLPSLYVKSGDTWADMWGPFGEWGGDDEGTWDDAELCRMCYLEELR